MVLMAQPFSLRHPTIIGQGNWGSADDPKSFAAFRYTEAKLSQYSQVLLKDLNAATSEWIANFDGTLKEPATLPARLPNILINGATGIAVGLSTDIPPHNIIELTNACITLLKKPKTSLEEIHQILPGPDYPTGAEITNSPEELLEIYRTGQGIIRQRAKHFKEDDLIIFNELPFQALSSKIIKQIADLIQAKKITQIRQLRDESDEESPIRIVLIMRSNRCGTDSFFNLLYANTDLEKTHRVNLTYINTERLPTQSGLIDLIKSWLDYREKCVLNRFKHALGVLNARIHIVEGLITIFDYLDEVIEIIRHEDEPHQKLKDRFKLSDIQATSILETKLKQLGRLQEHQLKEELKKLIAEATNLESLISDQKKRQQFIIDELITDRDQYGDVRRTQIIHRPQAKEVPLSQQIAKSLLVSSYPKKDG